MNSSSLNPNVQDLQTDVIELLGQVSCLMSRANTAFNSDGAENGAGKKYQQFANKVDEETKKVNNLELRMAIVAPMKAGKSTITNAIIGQEILPSRNAAMTTLPTEIVFNAEITAPTLALSDEIVTVFQDTVQALRIKIQKLGNDRVQEKIGKQTHLVELTQKIQNPLGLSISSQTTGFEESKNALTDLNDIIRLCSLLEPSKNPLLQLEDVPRIETPFWRSQKTDQSEMLGNLVIVDTPGPNEAGENLTLAEVVKTQLENSSIVLIVLNFTSLNTKADEDVKKEVQKVIELRGKENLYVLVNKVDQRRKGDMTPEDVKQFVASKFGIGDASNSDRVFELSAIRALSATKFLLEVQQRNAVDIAEMRTAEALAQETLGSRWEAKLKKATVDELKEEAEYLWEDSGFEAFLEKAIDALIESAAPRCMRSALNLSQQYLKKLGEDVGLQNSAIAKEKNELQEQINALDADLEQLEFCRERLKKVDTIKVKLQQNLNGRLEQLKKKAKVNLEEYFGQGEYERAGLGKKVEMGMKKMWEAIQGKNYKTSGRIEFPTAGEAEEFVDMALSEAKKDIDILLEPVRKEATEDVEKSCQDLLNFLKKETKEIIEKAQERLEKKFKVELSPPPMPDWKPIDFVRTKTERKTRQKTEYRTKKSKPWWLLWLVEFKEEVPITKTESYYRVDLKELIDNINEGIATSIRNINEAISHYLDKDFEERLKMFFDELDGHLKDYRDSLRQAQAADKLSIEEKEKLKDELTFLGSEAKVQTEKADAYLDRTNDLM